MPGASLGTPESIKLSPQLSGWLQASTLFARCLCGATFLIERIGLNLDDYAALDDWNAEHDGCEVSA